MAKKRNGEREREREWGLSSRIEWFREREREREKAKKKKLKPNKNAKSKKIEHVGWCNLGNGIASIMKSRSRKYSTKHLTTNSIWN